MTDTALRKAVLDRLDRLDRLIEVETNPESLLPIARSELQRLSDGLLVLLDEHQPDDNGRCPSCAGTAHNNPWPCLVWQTAHRQLISHRSSGSTDNTPAASPNDERRGKRSREISDVSVIPEPIVASTGPGPSDWNTGEFTRPNLTTVPRQHSPTPLAGHLETDHTKIHRAAVVSRR